MSDEDTRLFIKSKAKSLGLNAFSMHNMSDIVHSSSNGTVAFGYGHFHKKGERPYWNNSNRTVEVWADYFASLLTNNKEAAFIRYLFPDETAIMEEILEVMAREV